MRNNTSRSRSVARIVAASSATLLLLSACAEGGDSGGNNGGGEGVEYGATAEDFQAALADMKPVELTIQSTGPKGAPTGRRFENYAKTVEEWSGGKITFEFAYANAIAAPAEVDDALADGRIDVGSVITALDAAKYPANNALWDLSFVGRQTPVDGLLQWHGAMLQAAGAVDEISQEFEDNGMKALVPFFGSGSYFYDCSTPANSLSALDGKTTASQSRIQSKQAEALGMSSATVSYPEMFESLQRGVVDCAMSSMTTSSLGGFIDAAPYFSYDPEHGLAAPGGSFAVSLDVWEDLPLAAQQLMYDRLDVFLKANFEGTWDNVKAAMESIDAAGGAVTELDPSAKDVLVKTNRDVLASVAKSDAVEDSQGVADSIVAATDAWGKTVDDLGIDRVDIGYDDFADWYEAGSIDLDEYFTQLWAQSMDPRRPS